MRRGQRRFIAALAGAQLALIAPQIVEAKPYKGGELFSQQTFKYGRMEMRMRMAKGDGILSTFFTYKDGSEGSGTFWEEIDIEVFGKEDATIWQSNIITGLGDRTTSEEEHTFPISLADSFHTYALEWTPEYIAWEVDGVEARRTTSAQVADLESPQSLRFNLWAANLVSWVGEFDDSVLPQHQYILWIKYSSYQNGAFVHEWTDEFDTFDNGRWGTANWSFGENLVDFDPANVTVRDGALVLSLTREGQTGFTGQVPPDIPTAAGGASGAGGGTSMGTGGGSHTEQGSGGSLSAGTGGRAQTGAGGGSAPDGNSGDSTNEDGQSGGSPGMTSGEGISTGGTSTMPGSPSSANGCTWAATQSQPRPSKSFLYWIPALAALALRTRRRVK